MPTRTFHLGRAHNPFQTNSKSPGVADAPTLHELPPHHLLTHGVIVGMTGSGKTGLALAFVEEALRAEVPVLLLDVKGDLPNLLLSFPGLSPDEFRPWLDADAAARAGRSADDLAEELAARWRDGLATSGLGAADVAALRAGIAPRLITPGSTAGESLDILSALRAPSTLWQRDVDAAREALASCVSLLLRMVGRDPDPARSRDHVVLAHFAERRMRAGGAAGLPQLLADLAAPPVPTLGALALDDFLPPRERQALAQDLNTLLVSPAFATWQQGAALDIASWLQPAHGRTPAVLVSLAHLDDDERSLVLSLLLEQLVAWTRSLSGTSELRALVLIDEAFGLLPPHPAAPPTKRPLLRLLKQARAYGVGLMLATQNPMDLDYKALSNAGLWCVGRLPTDADRARVVEALAAVPGITPEGESVGSEALAGVLRTLPPRSFLVRDVHAAGGPVVLQTRWTMSWLRGPMTRHELRDLAATLRPAPVESAPAPPEAAVQAASAGEAPSAAAASPGGMCGAAEVRAALPLAAAVPSTAITVSATPVVNVQLEQPGPARLPPTWRAWRICEEAGAGTSATSGAWVVASAVVHVREPRYGIARNETLTLAAPLDDSGRPDMARVRGLDRGRLELDEGAASDAWGPLAIALRHRRTAEYAERALREHAFRAQHIEVRVHRELAIASGPDETAAAFADRCRAVAHRRAELAARELEARYAPRVHRLAARVAAARVSLTRAERDAREMPGLVGAAFIGMVAGQRNADRVNTARNRAMTLCERARRDLHDAEEALASLVAEREAAQAALTQSAEHAGEQVQTRSLAARRSDVELVEIGVARFAPA